MKTRRVWRNREKDGRLRWY